MINCIIIIVILFFLYYSITYNTSIEGYDAKLSNTTLDDCSKFCKTTAGCYGFAYNNDKKICYPSQDMIIGRPEDTVYRGEYTKDNIVCNKSQPITTELQTVPFDQRRANSIFVCTNSEEVFPQTYLHNEGKLTKIGEGKNIDEIFQIDDYKVDKYDWTKRILNNNELSVLHDGLKESGYKINNISDIESIINKESVDIDKYEGDNNKESLFMNIWATIILWFYKLWYLFVPNDHKNYKEFNKINKGQYLKWFKCQRNIPLNKCIQYCNDNKECIGIEHNPLFMKDKNVCCPYTTLDLQDRDPKYSNGTFYFKN